MTSVTAFAPATVSNVACGFDIMGFGGPISAAEEAQLRAKFFNVEFVPGVDKSHPLL